MNIDHQMTINLARQDGHYLSALIRSLQVIEQATQQGSGDAPFVFGNSGSLVVEWTERVD